MDLMISKKCQIKGRIDVTQENKFKTSYCKSIES